MQRKQRTHLIIEYGKEKTIQWAETLTKNHETQTIVPPRSGLLMIKQRETAQNTLYYSGEMLMTECKVREEDQIGYGLIKGDQPEFAFALAMIDLAFNADWPETKEILDWLEVLEKEHEHTVKQMTQRYQKTKVDFSTMNQ